MVVFGEALLLAVLIAIGWPDVQDIDVLLPATLLAAALACTPPISDRGALAFGSIALIVSASVFLLIFAALPQKTSALLAVCHIFALLVLLRSVLCGFIHLHLSGLFASKFISTLSA
jgi:hypothetical protein